jgi:hypothetical protein
MNKGRAMKPLTSALDTYEWYASRCSGFRSHTLARRLGGTQNTSECDAGKKKFLSQPKIETASSGTPNQTLHWQAEMLRVNDRE